MTDPIIRPLTFEDLDEGLRLSTAAGWNQTLDDWRMLLRLAPAGAFAAVVDQFIVGTAIGIDYGAFAWIAMMLVDPTYRGRGVGRRLLEAAIDAVPSSFPIRLDATPLGRPLYERYGFEDEAALSRYVVHRATQRPPAPCAVQPLTDADLALVVEQDRKAFSGSRGAVLDWAFRRAPQYAHAVRSNTIDGESIHYCLGRQGRVFDQIGPVVAGDDQIAHALVSAALDGAGDRPVTVDAFDSQRAFGAALRAAGFVIQRPLVRMCRASPSRAYANAGGPSDVREFAILGPEFA